MEDLDREEAADEVDNRRSLLEPSVVLRSRSGLERNINIDPSISHDEYRARTVDKQPKTKKNKKIKKIKME